MQTSVSLNLSIRRADRKEDLQYNERMEELDRKDRRAMMQNMAMGLASLGAAFAYKPFCCSNELSVSSATLTLSKVCGCSSWAQIVSHKVRCCVVQSTSILKAFESTTTRPVVTICTTHFVCKVASVCLECTWVKVLSLSPVSEVCTASP